MEIPPQYLDKMRSRGLLLSEPYVPHHVAFPDGVAVVKPTSVCGNNIPGYRAVFGDDSIEIDAPALCVYYKEGTWCVENSGGRIPGPGPGHFVDRWSTPEEAVADVFAFFFGDPARMNAIMPDLR